MSPPRARSRRQHPRPAAQPAPGAARPSRPGAWNLALIALFVAALAWRLLYLGRLAGTPPFFMGPLYPYVLTGLRAVLGDSIARVLVVQAFWGAGAAVLLADAAQRLTRPAIGIAVGLLVCVHPMAVFFDGLVLMESLLFFLGSLLLWQVVRARGGWRPAGAAALGALIGLLAEGRAISALLLLPAVPLVVGAWGGAGAVARPGAARRLAALVAAFALVVAPAAIRNAVVAHEWIPFTYNLGFNLYAGNNPEATGGFSTITGTQWAGRLPEDGGRGSDGRAYIRASEGLDLSPAASSAWWAARARRFIAEHPGRAATLGLTKLGMMWSRLEYPQIENADEYAALAGPLGIPVAWSFALVGTLGLAGLLLAWPRGATERFLILWVLGLTLAAVALDEALRAWRARAPAPRLRVGLALAAGLVVVMLPAPGLSRAKYEWGLALDLGTRWLEQSRPDRAAKEFERALEMERTGKVRRVPSATAAIERASLDYNYATALHLLGRDAEALPLYERAVAEAPDGAPELAGLAEAYRRAGRATDAARLESRLAGVAGGAGRLLLARGWEAARRGASAEAESLMTRAVGADPGLDDGWTALIRIQVERQEPDRAAETLAAARAAGLGGASLHAHEALVAAARRDRVAAYRALRLIPEQAIQGDPTVAEVVRVTRSLIEPSH